jgi:outer membrane protein assembly factor BamB
MTSQTGIVADAHPLPGPATAGPARPPRVWPAVVLLGLFWMVYAVWRWTELGASLGFLGFLILLGVGGLTALLFAVWWLAASRIRWMERFAVLGTAVGCGLGVAFLADKRLGPFVLLPGLPLVLTAWTLGLAVARKWPPRRRCVALLSVLCLSWGAFLPVRGEGMGGDGQIALRWRWAPTPEQAYLAEPEGTGPPAGPADRRQELGLRPGDWPGFRGPERDGTLRGVRIATDWDSAPPKLVWRRRVGPAWSSVVVVGDRLFTQEQRGEWEAVVCLDAATGRTLWSHQDAARHEDVQGGAGPRATPAFAGGRLFALGATGILNCLDAGTGDRLWSRDLAADAETKVPLWGFASSPLVVGDVVVVFAGGAGDKTLLAYRADTGTPAWSAAAGKVSYSSAQLASVGGAAQLLFVSDRGLSAFDPSSGAVLWEYATPAGNPGVPRAVQPRAVGPDGVLFDAGPDLGTALVEVAHADGSWVPKERWVSRQLKPSFNDFVVHQDAIYGFDGRVLACVDLQTGKRRWKDGRYGSGQVLLLGDQPLLVVVTDEGQVVLVAANPNEHQELGRFQAVEGKTWNHPVIAHGRLYVRNAQEVACYELRLGGPVEPAGRTTRLSQEAGPPHSPPPRKKVEWKLKLGADLGHAGPRLSVQVNLPRQLVGRR